MQVELNVKEIELIKTNLRVMIDEDSVNSKETKMIVNNILKKLK